MQDETIYSFSRLESFHNCLRNYYYTYVLHKRGGDNIYSFLGTSVHDTVEAMDAGKMDKSDGYAAFLEAVDDADMMGLPWISGNVKLNFVESIAHYFQNYVYQEIPGLHIEDKFVVNVGGVNLMGFIDKWFRDGNTIYIEDYKTSTKFKPADMIHKQRQLAIYARALEDQFPDCKFVLRFNMLKYVIVGGKLVERYKVAPSGTFEPGLVAVEYTPELRQEVENYVVSTVDQIHAMDFDDIEKWSMAFNPQKDFFCNNLCGNKYLCIGE